MFPSVGSIYSQDSFVLLDEIRAMEVLGDVKGEMVTRGMVHREHLKRCGGGAAIAETVGVDAFTIGVFGENIAKGVSVAVEIGDDGGGLPIGAEIFVESGLLERIINGANSAVAECGDADEAEPETREIRPEDLHGIDGLASGDVAGGGKDKIGLFQRLVDVFGVVTDKAEDTGTAIVELELSVVTVDPTRFISLVECCKIYNILRCEHFIEDRLGSNVIYREETVDSAAGEIEQGGNGNGRLVREAIVILAPTGGSGKEIERRVVRAPFYLCRLLEKLDFLHDL